MDESIELRLQQAMEDFEKQRAELERVRDEISTLKVTVRSKDRVVEVTVGAQGEPTAMRFLNNKHQKMTGQELAASVLEALALARGEIGGIARSRFDAAASGGIGVAGSGLRDLDLERLLEPLTTGGPLGAPTGGVGRATPADAKNEGAERD
ncbi:YbaB/EbfC DNA-binding family protein [Actinacidiphila alni]|uniref:YbaB/EbfC DNA-binding family protein n=1 Tax=Actinacidiphila alni TaxID=380248 RepID=A0A1I2J2N2_9ACTN|nr:YbaB/EbfC family nucleoid-associated protein [Actinacidiphila alni]SFF47527.1 YbaB/EbfC DNA-binding family protein [Actinacidiphila alni]